MWMTGQDGWAEGCARYARARVACASVQRQSDSIPFERRRRRLPFVDDFLSIRIAVADRRNSLQ